MIALRKFPTIFIYTKVFCLDSSADIIFLVLTNIFGISTETGDWKLDYYLFERVKTVWDPGYFFPTVLVKSDFSIIDRDWLVVSWIMIRRNRNKNVVVNKVVPRLYLYVFIRVQRFCSILVECQAIELVWMCSMAASYRKVHLFLSLVYSTPTRLTRQKDLLALSAAEPLSSILVVKSYVNRWNFPLFYTYYNRDKRESTPFKAVFSADNLLHKRKLWCNGKISFCFLSSQRWITGTLGLFTQSAPETNKNVVMPV